MDYPLGVINNFWDKVGSREGGTCWLWTGPMIGDGYGLWWVNGKSHYAHRFAYEVCISNIPTGMQVDHICSNKTCVNPDHLRACTKAQNLQNVGRRKDNTSGFKGVHWHKRDERWVAVISVNKERISLGYFMTPEEAHIAYCKAAKKYHGEFANFG